MQEFLFLREEDTDIWNEGRACTIIVFLGIIHRPVFIYNKQHYGD
jgi:hypothetical protein